MKMKLSIAAFLWCTIHLGSITAAQADLDDFKWTELNSNTEWERRAGLQAVQLPDDTLVIIGGRTPKPPGIPFIPGDSIIRGDVWISEDMGKTWKEIVETADFPARAYFQAVTKGDSIFVLGGQNYEIELGPGFNPLDGGIPPLEDNSEFFSDVWESTDGGMTWQELTSNPGWEGRAGFSAIVFNDEIYVMAGSTGNDASLGGLDRRYFNDVWKSSNGVDWDEVTPSAGWAARAGASVTVMDGSLYILGGESGFVGSPPPYYNDVWKTDDGQTWELVTASAGWSPRPGHACNTIRSRIVCYGGFGLNEDITDTSPANPTDIWESVDGEEWVQLSGSPWNAHGPADVKYDFDSLVVTEPEGSSVIYTFGGDRETFNFIDLTQFKNVDNDVWRFGDGEAVDDDDDGGLISRIVDFLFGWL